jgi:hypothetical protein
MLTSVYVVNSGSWCAQRSYFALAHSEHVAFALTCRRPVSRKRTARVKAWCQPGLTLKSLRPNALTDRGSTRPGSVWRLENCLVVRYVTCKRPPSGQCRARKHGRLIGKPTRPRLLRSLSDVVAILGMRVLSLNDCCKPER